MNTKLLRQSKLIYVSVVLRQNFTVNKCGKGSGESQHSSAPLSGAVCKMDKDQINQTMKDFDEAIDKAEAEVARLQELRREFINQYNLNKETSDEDVVDQP